MVQHGVKVSLAGQWMLDTVKVGNGFALSVKALFIGVGDWRDKAIIGCKKPIARCCTHPVEQANIQRAIRLAGWRYAFDAGVHVGDALDHPPGGALWAVDADHGGNAGSPRPPNWVCLERGMVPDA